MKTKLLLLTPLFIATGVALAADPAARHRAGPADPANCPPGRGTGDCAALAASTGPLVLGAAAREALLFQIEEERMARELYTVFGAKWNLRPLANIPLAEARHEVVLRTLAERAGVTVPVATTGRFLSAEVQARFDRIGAFGAESAENALRAGALVEEQDIADLRALVATTDSAELRQAAAALETASGHHLAAFVRNLAARGITYAPQILAAADVEALTSGGGGGPGRGAGRGQGRNRGPGG